LEVFSTLMEVGGRFLGVCVCRACVFTLFFFWCPMRHTRPGDVSPPPPSPLFRLRLLLHLRASVLVRGAHALPGARDAILRLQQHGIPFICLTNRCAAAPPPLSSSATLHHGFKRTVTACFGCPCMPLYALVCVCLSSSQQRRCPGGCEGCPSFPRVECAHLPEPGPALCNPA
jgi:hypothetical protein